MQQKFSEFEMVFESTIGDKIFGDTVLIWGNFGQRNNPHPSPSPSLQDWGRNHSAKTFERPKEKSVNGLCVWLVLSQFQNSFLVCLVGFSPRHAKNVITCSLTGRPSTTVALVVVESVVNAQPIKNLSQSEAGVRRLCGFATAALENRRRQLRCSPNRLVTWGNIWDTSFFQRSFSCLKLNDNNNNNNLYCALDTKSVKILKGNNFEKKREHSHSEIARANRAEWLDHVEK